jgi:hypothetical protein
MGTAASTHTQGRPEAKQLPTGYQESLAVARASARGKGNAGGVNVARFGKDVAKGWRARGTRQKVRIQTGWLG